MGPQWSLSSKTLFWYSGVADLSWSDRLYFSLTWLLLIYSLVGSAVICTILGEVLPQDGAMFTKEVHFKVVVQLEAFAGISLMFFLAAISTEKSHSHILWQVCHVIMPTKCYVIVVSSVWLLAGFLQSGLFFCFVWLPSTNRSSTSWYYHLLGLPCLSHAWVSYTSIWFKFNSTGICRRPQPLRWWPFGLDAPSRMELCVYKFYKLRWLFWP